MHVCTYAWVYMHRMCVHACLPVCMNKFHVCMHVCVVMCMRLCVHVRAYVCLCVPMCRYVCRCVNEYKYLNNFGFEETIPRPCPFPSAGPGLGYSPAPGRLRNLSLAPALAPVTIPASAAQPRTLVKRFWFRPRFLPWPQAQLRPRS